PMWCQHISLVNGRKRIYSLLKGENMNDISVFEILPNGQTGNLVSKGRLRNIKTKDQGYLARALVYIPNKKEFPNQPFVVLETSTMVTPPSAT
ncbi:MAG: hypothetical protein WAX66_01460, partial [Patescibacteria group bacterium]